MNHQFSLFGHLRPVKKVPISEARIREVEALMRAGDKSAVDALRDIRYKLENFERRIRV